jgi:AmmeMemoRadiSam system protein A
MSSTETPAVYSEEQRQTLLQLARDSIRHGLEHEQPLPVQPEDYPDELQAKRACFVTLNKAGQLRGCIGHLEAMQSLVEDVAGNAYAAAFQDPRFAPVRTDELEDLVVDISVLSEPEPLPFEDRADLLSKIRPGIDGLILSASTRHRGTFLPSVWESLPTAEQFLQHLVMKAGLPAGYWSDELTMERYTTESFGEA